MTFLVFVRVCGSFAVFPFIRSYLRTSGTLVLSVAVTAWIVGGPEFIFANAFPIVKPYLHSAPLFILAATREIGVGVLLAAPLAIAFEVLPMAGRLVDDARGAQFAEQVNPELGRVSQFQELGNMLVPMVFLNTALFPLCSALSRSVSSPITASMSGMPGYAFGVVEYAVRAAAAALGESLSYAAPVILICLLLDFSIGLMSRFLTRINLNHELVPLKLVLGILLYGLFLSEVSPELPLTVRQVIVALLA